MRILTPYAPDTLAFFFGADSSRSSCSCVKSSTVPSFALTLSANEGETVG